jgi:hypothetical protein
VNAVNSRSPPASAFNLALRLARTFALADGILYWGNSSFIIVAKLKPLLSEPFSGKDYFELRLRGSRTLVAHFAPRGLCTGGTRDLPCENQSPIPKRKVREQESIASLMQNV